MRTLKRILLLLAVVAGVVAATMYFRPLWVADQQIHVHLWNQGATNGYVNVPEGRLHYYELRGPGGAGTPLVLVHGLGGRAEDFTAMMPRLAAAGFHVYVPDLLGYGRSSTPNSDYSIRTEEQVVLHFMDSQHLDHALVAGWSMGGWIALRMALDQPARVDRLVLFDAAGVKFDSDADTALFAPKDAAGVTRLIRALSPTMPVPPTFVQRDIIRRNGERAWIIDRSLSAMRTGKDIVDSELSGMKPPTLILWGVQDAITPLSMAQQMHALDPRSVLATVDGCGHYAPVECAQPFVDMTIKFLKADPPMQGGEVALARSSREHEPVAPPAPVKH